MRNLSSPSAAVGRSYLLTKQGGLSSSPPFFRLLSSFFLVVSRRFFLVLPPFSPPACRRRRCRARAGTSQTVARVRCRLPPLSAAGDTFLPQLCPLGIRLGRTVGEGKLYSRRPTFCFFPYPTSKGGPISPFNCNNRKDGNRWSYGLTLFLFSVQKGKVQFFIRAH